MTKPLTVKQLTLCEKILIAVYEEQQATQTTVALTTIPVAAWLRYPLTFQLGKFPHPDSHKVYAALMGRKGLVGMELLVKHTNKEYTVSEKGERLAKKLLGVEPCPKPVPKEQATLPPNKDMALRFMLSSDAWDKWHRNKEEIHYINAQEFWACCMSKRIETGQLALLDFTGDELKDLEATLDNGEAVLTTGRVVGLNTVHELQDLHGWLVSRFKRHLEVAKKREAVK